MAQVLREKEIKAMLKKFDKDVKILAEIKQEEDRKIRSEKFNRMMQRREMSCIIHSVIKEFRFINSTLSTNYGSLERENIICTLQNPIFAEFVVSNSFARRVAKGFDNMTDSQKERFVFMIEVFYENFMK